MNLFDRKDKNTGRRKPRFAGTWYENNPQKLEKELKSYLLQADQLLQRENLVGTGSDDGETGLANNALYAIIAPHAGYLFSGSTAAVSYELASKHRPKPERVFLMGPSHYVGFQGVALSPDLVFETPLGDLPLDREIIDELAQYPMFAESREVHQKEHSLELQLSFIRQALGEVKLVPMIIGQLPDASEVRLIGQIIRRYVGENDLVVVSSDFTHYGPRYDYVPFDCNVAPERVKQLDEEAFSYLQSGDLDAFLEFHNRTKCTICGFYPCAVLLSMLPPESRGHLLQYRTSRDTTLEDRENSVSYLSIAFTGSDDGSSWKPEQAGQNDNLLNESEKADLLKLARLTVENFAKNREIVRVSDTDVEVTPALRRSLGVFVTLFKRRRDPRSGDLVVKDGVHERELRGCIGYIWPVKPLVEAVVDNAIGACSKDPRFIEVRENELADLEIEISVLTPLTRVESSEEIQIGKHGVVLYLRGRQSVFLPHVATEFGWDLKQTLSQLSVKAGFGPSEWRNGARFDVFESIMFEEYQRHESGIN